MTNLVVVLYRLPAHPLGEARLFLRSPSPPPESTSEAFEPPDSWEADESKATVFTYGTALLVRDIWREALDDEIECVTVQPPGAKLHECLNWSDGSSTLAGPLTDDMAARQLVELGAVIEYRFMATCTDQWFTVASALRGHGIRNSMLDEDGKIIGLEPLDDVIQMPGDTES